MPGEKDIDSKQTGSDLWRGILRLHSISLSQIETYTFSGTALGLLQRLLMTSVRPDPVRFSLSMPAAATIVAPSKPALTRLRLALGT
jgi:hypothetical protein